MESATSTLRKGEKKAGVLRFPEIICCVVWIVIKMVNMSSTAIMQDQVTKTEAFACWWRRSQRSGDSIYQSKFYTRGIMDAKYWGYQALKFWKVLKSNWREIPIQDNERHCGPSVIWPGRDKVALFSCHCYCYWGTLKHSLFDVISCTSLWRNSWRSISFQVKKSGSLFLFQRLALNRLLWWPPRWWRRSWRSARSCENSSSGDRTLKTWWNGESWKTSRSLDLLSCSLQGMDKISLKIRCFKLITLHSVST